MLLRCLREAKQGLRTNPELGGAGKGREMGGSFKREGTYVHLRLIHDDAWQKMTKLCKAIVFQLKNTKTRRLKYITLL